MDGQLYYWKQAYARIWECADKAIAVFQDDADGIKELAENVQLKYDLKGKCAGRAYVGHSIIRLNLEVFRKHGMEPFLNTVTHEFAHIVADYLAGGNAHHGIWWKKIMTIMGAKPERCHSYGLTPARRVRKRFHYTCDCGTPHVLTAYKHGNMRKGNGYICRRCKSTLHFYKEEI